MSARAAPGWSDGTRAAVVEKAIGSPAVWELRQCFAPALVPDG